VDSSLLVKPQGLKTMLLKPVPSPQADPQASSAVKLSNVIEEHTQEATYTQVLEQMVEHWQDWYAKLVKSYGSVGN
jgi:hypothetical protein